MKATLTFPIRDNKIVLAIKQKKVGAGKWNGFGGKPEPDDTGIRHTAARELFEESGRGIKAEESDLQPKALIDFYFYDNTTNEPNWSVMIYIAEIFSGKASDTDEMKNATPFPFDKIPYGDMLPADRDFLPKILAGETFRGKVRFNETMTEFIELEYEPADAASLET